MPKELTLCKGCDEVFDTVAYLTPLGEGPFCNDCWEGLNDPDETLRLESHLRATEQALDEAKRCIEKLERINASLKLALECAQGHNKGK